MNFKSRILKLSIIIMLVLVLIPVVAAEDSSESFFIEYADQIDEEVVVEESYSIEEVEYAQEDVSVSSEVPAVEEKYEKNFAHMESGEEIEEFNSDISISEQDCSVVEAHDIVEEKEDIPNLYCENINDVVDFNNINYEDMSELETKELTIEINQVINQDSIFISKHDYSNVNFILKNDLFAETTSFETTGGFKRSLFKVLELKNNLLINQDIQFVFVDNFSSDVDGDVIVSTDKTANDFVFSIDNSVVGDEGLIIFENISFCLNFNTCFDAFFCCKFLDVECFCGDFL